MMSVEEGWHTVEDGKKLYTKTWKVRVRYRRKQSGRLTRIADERSCESSPGLHTRLQRPLYVVVAPDSSKKASPADTCQAMPTISSSLRWPRGASKSTRSTRGAFS